MVGLEPEIWVLIPQPELVRQASCTNNLMVFNGPNHSGDRAKNF